MSLPVVAIVGRPNVGKSTMFNRLAGRMISIVDDRPGITRDRLMNICQVDQQYFELVDTGGFGVEEFDVLSEEVEKQIRFAIEKADLLLFVVDAQSGIMPLDEKLAKIIRTQEKPVLLVANKADNPSLGYDASIFLRFGFGDPVIFSALHALGKDFLLDQIIKRLPRVETVPPKPVMKFAIVGARNVGKSTFINTLAGEERVIVSEMPGTTRDAIDVRFEIEGKTFLAIDTAGVMKKGKIKENVDFYSSVRAERSIRRADVVLLLIDASENIAHVTKRLAGYVVEEFKPCIIVVNKWDLAQGKADIEDYQKYIGKILPGMPFAPISLTCAMDGTNVRATIKLAEKLYEQAKTRVSTSELNKAIEYIRSNRPPNSSHLKSYPKFYYATQIDTCPPTIVMFVNNPDFFGQEYQRYVMNRIRELLPFKEIPLRLLIRTSPGREKT
ncbi:MAG: ribosome biogenesis GTPase Der [Phycisphaerae bacterium]